jgi:hypothetical protein
MALKTKSIQEKIGSFVIEEFVNAERSGLPVRCMLESSSTMSLLFGYVASGCVHHTYQARKCRSRHKSALIMYKIVQKKYIHVGISFLHGFVQ